MKKYIKLLVLLAWMGLIFFLSSQPSAESEETSNMVAGVIYAVYSFVMNGAAKLSESDFMARFAQPIRKLAHFSEFAFLAVLMFMNVIEYRKKNAYLISFILSVAYAVSDEIHQLFVENRYCSLTDMAIDSAGCLLGIIICRLIYERWKNTR